MTRKGQFYANPAALLLAAAALTGITVAPAVALEQMDAVPIATAGSEDPGRVLIVNNHLYAVTVYAVTEAGKRFRLGDLARSSAKLLTVPEEAVEGSSVLVKVYPVGPIAGLGAAAEGNPGIKTHLPVSTTTPRVALWLEPDLAQSYKQEAENIF